MKKILFNVPCMASYLSSISIPNEMEDENEILKYINEHISEAEIESPLGYVSDLDGGITADDVNWKHQIVEQEEIDYE